jgi:hypothetical protein
LDRWVGTNALPELGVSREVFVNVVSEPFQHNMVGF